MKSMDRVPYNIQMAAVIRDSGKAVERVAKERLLMPKTMSMWDLGLMIKDTAKV